MNIRFYNAKILTMEQPVSILEGELWVQGNRIIYVGDGTDIEKVFSDNLKDGIVGEREIYC